MRAGLTDAQTAKRDLAHRNSHTGVQWLNLKLLWVDHLKRFPSLLHFVLNSTSSTLVIGLKAAATKAQIEAMNTVFHKHHCYYRFKTAKGARDAKSTGNECRKILWTRGLLLELVVARWGPAVSAADRAAEREVTVAQGEGEHLLDDDPTFWADPARKFHPARMAPGGQPGGDARPVLNLLEDHLDLVLALEYEGASPKAAPGPEQ